MRHITVHLKISCYSREMASIYDFVWQSFVKHDCLQRVDKTSFIIKFLGTSLGQPRHIIMEIKQILQREVSKAIS